MTVIGFMDHGTTNAADVGSEHWPGSNLSVESHDLPVNDMTTKR